MRTARLKWTLLGILTVAFAALAPSSTVTYAGNPYTTPDPTVRYIVQEVWYNSEVKLVEPFVASTSHDRVKVTDVSLLKPGWTIEIVSDHGPIPERMLIRGFVGQCDGAVDDDGDGYINDGCPVFDDGLPHPETGDQCANALDDDGDGKVNDGCPVVNDGVLHPETGDQCNFNYDDDDDGYINDGCPAADVGGPQPETGAQCDNALDDDLDGKSNDGCPAVDAPETGAQCSNEIDDDGDGHLNDGCPATSVAEVGFACNNNLDDDDDGYVNDGCMTRDPSNEGEPGSECTNMLDDDSDAKVNDGCPAVGAPETGTQCDNQFDNDGDGKSNDGCPAVDAAEETDRCANAVDDDADGYVNDGCSEYHVVAETGTQCANALDDDADGYFNDGCPAVSAAETATRDTMVVQRALNAVLDSHSAGLPIRDHVFRTDFWVKDVPSTHVYGVGGVQLYVHFDPTQLEYVKSTLDLSWLTSTGRSAWPSGPTLQNGDTIHAQYLTSGDPYNPPWPKGPTGSGRIATVWFRVLSPDSLVSRRFTLTGTSVWDVNTGAEITSLVQAGTVKTVICPDANLDGTITPLDGVNVRKNLNDGGLVSGATLAADIDKDQTSIPISAQGSLAVGKIVAVDNEHMRITGIGGSPLAMTVQRGIYTVVTPTNKPHSAGSAIFIANSDGNYDTIYGFTSPRDTNKDLMVNGLDAIPVYSTLDVVCPE